MKRRMRVATLSAVAGGAAAAAWLGFEVAKIPRPSEEDNDYDQGLTTENWSFTTEDGAVLKGKRYVNEGAQPVILAHGFLGNGFEFDLPRHDRNMAVDLARKGYDVWVSSFRGNGREPYLSQALGWKHSMDDLAAYDVPALIEGVTGRTGRKPVWIGHSMGGMVLYMYLQGATFSEKNGERVFSASPDLAEERNMSVVAGIAIGSPPAFHWEKGGFFGLLSNSLVMKTGLKTLYALTGNTLDIFPRLPMGVPMSRMVDRFPRLQLVFANHTPVGWVTYNWDNVEPDAVVSLLRWAGDDVSSRMARQGLYGIINTDFRSFDRSHSYTDNMERITAPFLFLTGSKDAANPDTIRTYGYEKVSCREKEFVNLHGFGHTDLVMGRDVQDKAYPVVTDWLERVL